MPSDVASDKVVMLERLGARVTRVPPVSIIDANHYVNLARRHAEEMQASQSTDDQNGALFLNQFENVENSQAHFDSTGPEIYSQTNGDIDFFVMGAGATYPLLIRVRKPSLLGESVGFRHWE
jgi:cysteine synthase A